MINRALYNYTAGLPARLIKLEGRPHLEQYYLGRILGVTFYLHRFVSGDSERHMHNHPWHRAAALVLTGGYTEEYVTDLCPDAGPYGCLTERRRIRWYHRIDGNRFHRIHAARPGTWTLFMHGPWVKLPGGTLKGWGSVQRGPTGTLTVFRPHTPTTPLEWWHDAPLGRDAGRELPPPHRRRNSGE